MKPIIDPRAGDVDDDASSTAQRSFISLAGSLLAEVSLPKLVAAWILMVGLPALALGTAPLVASAWLSGVSSKVYSLLTGLWPVMALLLLAGAAWFGGRPLLRLAETNFWSLNALVVQPVYVLCRETLRHLVEGVLPKTMSDDRRALTRAVSAVTAGLLVSGLAASIVAWVWPSTRWLGEMADLLSLRALAWPALANAVALIAGYLAVAALVWGVADAAMSQPGNHAPFDAGPATGRRWRVAHLSDIHIVGQRYGFRIESGRAGPQGNERLLKVLARLRRIHDSDPLHVILVTGDITDAGLSSEWVEFFEALDAYPELAERLLFLPGNHDLNVVDRANPARLDLPTSPKKRLRQLRMISAMEAVQGKRVRLYDQKEGRMAATLSEAIEPFRSRMAQFADSGSLRHSFALRDLWAGCFPMIVPPEEEDGLGVILLNSNIEAHFSFTNALGMVGAEQARAIVAVTRQYPRAGWIVALHHHVVEYPGRAKALSERIGTALINGSWFIRQLRRLAGRVVVMHGHRHIDWIGDCGGVAIVSAPSPVMTATDDADAYFYIHTLAALGDGRIRLMTPERVGLN